MASRSGDKAPGQTRPLILALPGSWTGNNWMRWISSALGSAGNWPGQVVAAAEVAVEMQHHSHGLELLVSVNLLLQYCE